MRSEQLPREDSAVITLLKEPKMRALLSVNPLPEYVKATRRRRLYVFSWE